MAHSYNSNTNIPNKNIIKIKDALSNCEFIAVNKWLYFIITTGGSTTTNSEFNGVPIASFIDPFLEIET